MSRRPVAEGEDGPGARVLQLTEQMAARLRRLGTRHWREQVGPAGETVGDVVHGLVVRCARREAELLPFRPEIAALEPERPRYDAALADQLAVVGRDLAEALNEAGGDALVDEVVTELREYAARLRLAVDG